MRRWWLPYAVVLVAALALGGCGVSATDRPVDLGDAAAGGPPAGGTREPPGPDDAGSADDLVRNFLQVSAGGPARVKEYLTGAALEGWADPNVENPPLSIVRIVSGPAIGAADSVRGTPVTVAYQPVGVLNDQGRVNELAPLEQPRSLTFWVVVSEGQYFRIGEIEGWSAEQLLLSDEGLTEYYRMQPVYFWDTAYQTLVPDLRWVPRTVPRDEQARRRVNYLIAGPSFWLVSGVQALPVGTSAESVATTEGGALEVKLSAAAAAPGDGEATRRLVLQLQWSLADGESTPRIDLYIDNQLAQVEVDENARRGALHTLSYQRVAERYDIVEGVVQAVPPASTPPLLSGTENAAVVSAAISKDPEAAAFVHDDGFGRRTLQVVSDGQSLAVDLPLQANSSLGRPSFVPKTDLLVVPTGGPNGRLVAVSVATGATSDATTGSLLPGVSAAVVSPDGRRVALIANGALYVAPLNVGAGTVTVGSATRQLLAGQLTATAVTWTSDSWLLVSGTRSDEEPTLWRVTADGVVARDLSSSLVGLRVQDLVCWPDWRATLEGDREVLAVTDQGVYSFRSPFRSQFSPGPNFTAPFFG